MERREQKPAADSSLTLGITAGVREARAIAKADDESEQQIPLCAGSAIRAKSRIEKTLPCSLGMTMAFL
jgi:hypothetical protein